MEKLVTILFDSEELAIEASKAIQRLAINKDIAIVELYVLSKNEQGNITVRDAQNQEIPKTLADSVIGILCGPLNILAGLTTGLLIKGRGISNLLHYSKTSKMLQKASETIKAGKTAIVAHIDEYWEIPLNMILEPFDVNVRRVTIDNEIDKYVIEKKRKKKNSRQ